MKLLTTLFILLTAFSASLAQSTSGYTWEDERAPYSLSEKEAGEPVLQLLFQVMHEYAYENDELVFYYTKHEIIRVNNDEAIAQHNQIYIPMQSALELTEIRARTIKKDGSVIELDKNNIKEVEDQEKGSEYKIFAIEGAETGSEIEYFYKVKRNARYFGREYFQGRIPVKNARFELSSPKNLKFEFKSYNDFTSVTQSDNEEKNEYTAEMSDIPRLNQEDFAIYDQNRKRIEYRLSYNTATSRARLLTWEDVGKRIYGNTYSPEKKEVKDLENWLKGLKLDKLDGKNKAARIEDEIKKNFYLDESGSASDDMSDILNQKVATKFGMHRLMCNALKAAGVNHEIVLTSDRSDLLFDGEFESYNYLEDYLIYLTDEQLFIAPYARQLRIGLTPAEYSANQGLFIGSKVVREQVFAVSEIREIPALPYEMNFDNLQVDVSFTEDLSANNIAIERSFKGYTSSYIKAVLPFLEEKDKDEMIGDFIKYVSPDAEFNEKEFVQAETDWAKWSEPLVIKGQVTSSHFIEMAGNTILFKAGELIGPQSELYQETERTMDVANDYNRGYLREIRIALPQGYTIQNPDDLAINEFTENTEGRKIYLFSSEYEIKGNELTITIDEYYDEIYYPAEQFEDFRKVINAAADFNKIVLVLKKT